MNIEFDAVLGQSEAKKQLRRALQHQRLAHAYLFTGAEGTGKLAMALELARTLLCENGERRPCKSCPNCRQAAALQHPNLELIFAHPKAAKEEEVLAVRKSAATQPYQMLQPWPNASISIERIREIRRVAGLKSLGGGNRVIILLDAHSMTVEATNALLKILEEPPEATYFVLTSAAADRLLPTILSRCQHVKFVGLSTADIEIGLQRFAAVDDNNRRLVAGLANGNMRRALELTGDAARELKQQAVEFMRTVYKLPHERARYAVELVARADRVALRELLESVQLWLRDAMLVAALGDDHATKHLANQDEVETFTKFSKNVPDFDYQRAVRLLELSINRLDRYVQPVLVVQVLLQQLRACSEQTQASRAA